MKKWIVGAMIVLASISAVGADTTKGMSVKNGNVLVGTVNDNGAKLQVVGDVSVTGNITSSGIITGNIVNGVTLKYNNTDINSNQALSNVAYLDKANTFNQGQVVNGNIDSSGTIRTTNTTQSNSIDTGALIVNGGIGTAGNITVGGTIKISNSRGTNEYGDTLGLNVISSRADTPKVMSTVVGGYYGKQTVFYEDKIVADRNNNYNIGFRHKYDSVNSDSASNEMAYTISVLKRKDSNSVMEASNLISVKNDGVVGISSLAGTGNNRVVTAGSSGNLAATNFYKEGIFTPTITFGGNSAGINYSTESTKGRYVKIGRLIFLNIQICLTSKGTSTGELRILGTPFSNDSFGAESPLSFDLGGLALTVTQQITCWIVNGTSEIILGKIINGSSASFTDSDITNTSTLIISGCFMTAN